MALTVNMPQLGESVTEGTIAKWLKQPGDSIARYESIAEVITDKVNAEIPAPADGTMAELIAPEGAVVAVGQPICSIETGAAATSAPGSEAASGQGSASGAAAPASPLSMPPPQQPAPAAAAQSASAAAGQPAPAAEAPPAAASAESTIAQQGDAEAVSAQAPAPPLSMSPSTEPSTASAQRPSASPATNGSDVAYHLTPAVRMLVREHGVDLSQITGSGIGGRITKKDVLEYVQRRDAGTPVERGQPVGASAATSQAERQRVPPAEATLGSEAPQQAAQLPQQRSQAAGDTLLPMTSIRRSIADHMVRSKQTSPHAYLMMEVDMSAVSHARTAARAGFEQRYGVKLTFLPFVARAVCEALRRHPTLNATWSDEGVVLKRDVHLGIAVALEDNLVVPVVRNADRLNIAGLATTMADLGERARQNRLKLDEIQGGTFTLNNTGALGAVMTQAIINQPQAAIMTMDLVVKRPVVIDDAIAIRPIMNLGMSFDHRINDGLQATRFVKTVKELLEGFDPSAALL